MAQRRKKNTGKTPRRGFLKTVALAGGLSGAAGGPFEAGAQAPGSTTASAGSPPVEFPRRFEGRQLKMIGFPLGGVGAGSVSLGGRGQLRDWEIFNRPDKGKSPLYGFAAIRAQRTGGKGVSRVLESRILPPYEGPSGLGFANVPGLPRLDSATFRGEYPAATIEFEDRELPVKVTLEAFTPWVPLDAEESGLPVAILRYRLENLGARSAAVSVAFSIDNPVGTTGRANRYQEGAGLAGLMMENPFLAPADPLAGSFTLAALERGGSRISYLRGWRGGTRWRVGPLLFWDDFTADGELGPEAAVRDTTGSLCVKQELSPRGRGEVTFVLSWHFPRRTPERCGWEAPEGEKQAWIGNHYTARFRDAWSAAEYTAARLEELERRTRSFAAAMRETTLPDEVKEAASANLSTLSTSTCFRTADGAFHGFEGSNNQQGCCFGNCTHVWNYEAATAHLFPALARSLRETAFGYSTDAEGRMDFRQILPDGRKHFGVAAADGQMGQILHLYLDWRLSGDNAWLRRLWPAAKRALAFAWIEGGWDANKDGVMEGVQHNTYDVEFLGPNPLCGVWYLGALRAAEEMARALGETAEADEYRRLFLNGSRWLDANLFNGEYYVQKIEGMPREKVARGLTAGMGAADTLNPDFQLGDGCLVDQLAGQYLADVCGLGALLDPAHIRKTLESIYRYNYKRSLREHESVQRVYALNDEAALVICSYDKGRRPEIPFPYFAEVMTGFEYSAAVLMMEHGMTAEGVEVIGNIRRRYDGERRNPWDEAECGHHYARAMASWSAIPILSGFRYSGAERRVRAVPRVRREDFRSVWSAATAWGTFAQRWSGQSRRLAIRVSEGELGCRAIEVGWRGEGGRAGVRAAGKTVGHRWRDAGDGSVVELAEETRIHAGEEIAVEWHPGKDS